MSRPTLTTERLVLRPFVVEDASELARLAGDRRIAETTLNIPHPYDENMAVAWIGTHAERAERDEGLSLAMTDRETGAMVGAAGLGINRVHRRGELGYWVSADHWGRGYATEASRALIDYAFGPLDLTRIVAHCLTRNASSRRVMEKLGMQCEARLRQHIIKWDVAEDIWIYGVLRDEWRGPTRAAEHGP